MLRQRPIRGGRERVNAAVERRIEKVIERTMARFSCSRSFVIAVALADAFGVELDRDDRYEIRARQQKRTRKRRMSP